MVFFSEEPNNDDDDPSKRYSHCVHSQFECRKNYTISNHMALSSMLVGDRYNVRCE